MAGGPVQSIYFDKLAGGMMPYAEPLAVGPETYPHIWADLKNLIPWRGHLQRREGVMEELDNPPALPEGPTPDFPILICGFQYAESFERFLLVTSRNLWITNTDLDSGWSLITPTYTSAAGGGLVTVTNGSPIVTGPAGSDFITRRIGPGQAISLGGVWYTILSVDSETQLTLTENYAGTTSPPDVAYVIRRTWVSSGPEYLDQYAAAVLLNGDIYVTIRDAGVYGAGLITGATGVVLKIDRGADSTKNSFTPADVSIVMSTDAMEAATYALGLVFIPKGLEVLEDGRLVLAAHVFGTSPAYEAANRILFSSHLDVTNWGPPGGFTDLIGARGGITGMRRMGGALAVHFQDQVQLGQISGSDTDPLTWRPTRATCGAAGPRVLLPIPATANLPGGQIFLATTGELHLFDGDQSPRLPSAWGDLVRDEAANGTFFTPVNLGRAGHLNYDEFRRSVSLFGPFTDTQSHELRYDLDTGVNSRHVHKNLITAAHEPRMQPYGQVTVAPYAARLIGVRGTNTGDVAATAYIYAMSLEVLNDSVLPMINGGTPTGCLAETHDLLLGTPDRENRVQRVVLWFHGRAAVTETIKCSLSVDSGLTWELGVGSTAITLAAPSGTPPRANERRVVFYFSTSAPADRARIRIESSDTDVFSFALSRMLIDYVAVADVRAVA